MEQVRPFGDLKIEPPENQITSSDNDGLEKGPEGANNFEELPARANEVLHPSIIGDNLPHVINQLATTGGECYTSLTNDVDLVGQIAAESVQCIEDSQKWPEDPLKREIIEIIRGRSSPNKSTSELQPFITRSPSTLLPDANVKLPADGSLQELEQINNGEALSATGARRVDCSESSSSSSSQTPSSHRLRVEMKGKSSQASILDKSECPPSDLSTTNVREFQILEPQIDGGTALYIMEGASSHTRTTSQNLEPGDSQQQIHNLGTKGNAQGHFDPFLKQESLTPSGIITAQDEPLNFDALDALSKDMMNADTSLFQLGEEVLESQNSRVREGRSFGDYASTMQFSSQISDEDPLVEVDKTVIDSEKHDTAKGKGHEENVVPLNSGLSLNIITNGGVHIEDTFTTVNTLAPFSAPKDKRSVHDQQRSTEDDTITGDDSQEEIPSRPAKRVKISPQTSGEKKQPHSLPLSNISSIQETPRRRRHGVNSISSAKTPMTNLSDVHSMGSTVEVRIPRSLRKSSRGQPLPELKQQQSRRESGGTPVSSGSSVRTRKSVNTASSLISPSEKSSLKILYASSTNVDNLRSVMKVLKKYGVRQVQKVADCDYLCVGHGKELKKTGRLILAVAMGKYVISDEWAKKSAEHGRLLDPQEYLAKDLVREKEWGIDLTAACERGQQNAKPLLGRKILFTPFVSKDLGNGFAELKDIAKQTGATLIQARLPRPAEQNDDTLIISSDLDPDLGDLRGNGWRCFTTDIITVSVLRGAIDTDSDEFSLTAGKTSQESGRKKRKRQS